jgi:hypothetical protein
MMRIAGGIVLVATMFVSFYVSLESFAMQRRMKLVRGAVETRLEIISQAVH